MDINTWLQEHPKPEEVKENEDGSQYIPIGIVEKLLDEGAAHFDFGNWGTKKFQIQYHFEQDLISASIDLEFDNRTVTGGITFRPDDYAPNEDFAAIAISECIKNAAKKLGNRFGRSLNGRTENFTPKPKKQSVKLKPDVTVMNKYLYYLTEGNEEEIQKLTSIYDIKTA
jgi:hypothetical protein